MEDEEVVEASGTVIPLDAPSKNVTQQPNLHFPSTPHHHRFVITVQCLQCPATTPPQQVQYFETPSFGCCVKSCSQHSSSHLAHPQNVTRPHQATPLKSPPVVPLSLPVSTPHSPLSCSFSQSKRLDPCPPVLQTQPPLVGDSMKQSPLHCITRHFKKKQTLQYALPPLQSALHPLKSGLPTGETDYDCVMTSREPLSLPTSSFVDIPF